ncbi:STELLO glycosyltransferase family protein [uncultured Algoriphagus sp.]|uniref:STELLO glycosyltransferase family protein n=1 Tax=uncultured Algoriphagus sp. TaxID=417365 RepID=UPI0025984376|nr:STELLO glycosyltransferase family protein [uncultured Algoriphagus sp.]
MKDFIVITSIYKASQAILSLSKLPEKNVIVVGDKKTPKNWSAKGVKFIPIEEQLAIGPNLFKHAPYNHYSRKMFGYIYAARNNAKVIIDTDDDNIPLDNYGFPPFSGNFKSVKHPLGFVNIYQYYTDKHIWPRGLPLNLISKKFSFEFEESFFEKQVGVWQGLADIDPDVDSLYRLILNEECFFNKAEPIILSEGVISPFNSQNTAFRKDLFPLLYLPSSVTFRFTDILRGLIAQPIMWLYGYKLGFLEATVKQERNYHNLMEDFRSEVPMYLYGEKITELVQSVINGSDSMENNIFNSYIKLAKEDMVNESELKALEGWLKDLIS